MKSVANETLDKAGEKATSLIGNAAGAVADPKTGFEMAKSQARKKMPMIALFVLAVIVVALKLRRSGD